MKTDQRGYDKIVKKLQNGDQSDSGAEADNQQDNRSMSICVQSVCGAQYSDARSRIGFRDGHGVFGVAEQGIHTVAPGGEVDQGSIRQSGEAIDHEWGKGV